MGKRHYQYLAGTDYAQHATICKRWSAVHGYEM